MTSRSTPSLALSLAARDAQSAVAFYKAAFGAVERYRLDGDKGTIAVARLSIGSVDFWVQDDVAAGAAIVAPMHEAYGWRTGRVTDPFGHDWEISKQLS